MSDIVFDHIIVGAGTAGCLLANRLSADRSKRVLLIEAGRKDDYHWIHIPVGYLYCIGNPRTDWLYQTEPSAGLNGRTLRYPRGKTLGGSSSINGMIYMRGQAQDYERWAEVTGDAAWRWDQVLPDFKRHEDHYKLDAGAPPVSEAFAALHGSRVPPTAQEKRINGMSGGEWRVEKQRLRWDVLDDFAKAAQQAGIPATDDFNGGDNEGVSYFEVNQRQGWRWNTAKAFLRPTCYGRPNFEMWTSAQVSRLLLEGTDKGQRCTGVEVWTGTEMTRAMLKPGGELSLCAGSVGSPQILQLSGIGPGELLRRHGITVQRELAGRGRQLAGPPANSLGLQDPPAQGRAKHAQHLGRLQLGAHENGSAVCAAAPRPHEHGALAAGRFHALRPRPAQPQHPVPRAAPVAGRLWRAAAPL